MEFKSKIKLPEVTSLPTPSSDTEGDVVKKGDSVYICRDSRWRKIYPPVNYGIDVPRLAGQRATRLVWPQATNIINQNAQIATVYAPLVVPYGCVVSSISINVTTALSGSTALLGIYDSELRDINNGGYYYPNNRLRSGTINTGTTGLKTVTFDTPLELLSGELYFLAFARSASGTLNITSVQSAPFYQLYNALDNSYNIWAIVHSNTSMPDPAPTSGYTNTTGYCPVFTLTLSDVFLF
jgi:hypothetical protein